MRKIPQEATSIYIEEIFPTQPSTPDTTLPNTIKSDSILKRSNYTLQPVEERDNSTGNGRPSRQETDDEGNLQNENEESGDAMEEREPRQESSEEESGEDEDGGGGGIGGLISAFLSSLSRVSQRERFIHAIQFNRRKNCKFRVDTGSSHSQ